MIVNQELVRKIKDYFDLNIYETKVWLALLSKGIVSAGETAELSGVPRSRTYDVLESLAKRGFAVVKVGKPIKYIAVRPEQVLEKMKSNVFNDAQEKVKTLANLNDTKEFTELQQLYKTGISPIKSEEISGFMRGRQNIMTKIKELADSAEKEVFIYTSIGDFEDKSRVLLPVIDRLNKDNIKVKIALSGEPERVKKLNSKFNLKAKHADHPGRLYIADKKEVLFMINQETADEEVAIWLNTPFFSKSLAGMYEKHLGY
ncbi:hypothetical protein COU60_03240 [Candidatus Pacearchaeota archaeon CG10_big_fil_rev_8_21_14_0_10_34_76]|nr:MAG: hypothetical protein COU60_03240 [Candidatus Pacearchaeota archaeon CG10_big_fil_rev_8_21_14_0_10_34_76]